MKKIKRGQFYLLAALILIVILIGFAATYNYIQKKDNVKIYNLKEELNIEGGSVLEYGTFDSSADLTVLMHDFLEDYSQYATQDKASNLYFIFGNAEELYFATYQEIVTGDVSIGEATIEIAGKTFKSDKISSHPGETVELKVTDKETKEVLTFPVVLKDGENFYFVVSQESGDEVYIEYGSVN